MDKIQESHHIFFDYGQLTSFNNSSIQMNHVSKLIANQDTQVQGTDVNKKEIARNDKIQPDTQVNIYLQPFRKIYVTNIIILLCHILL